MFLSDDIKKIEGSPRDVRNFGLLIGGIFLCLGFWFYYSGRNSAGIFILVGAVLILLGLVSPRLLKPIYKGWMMLAVVLGFVMTSIILTIFFYLLVTPFALVARATGKHFLDLGFRNNKSSYWNRRSSAETAKANLEKQF